MAILKTQNEKIKLKDGVSIIDEAEDLGMLFSCRAGICNVCQIKVVSEMENLNEANDLEKQMGSNSEKRERLACQCVISQGTVEIDF